MPNTTNNPNITPTLIPTPIKMIILNRMANQMKRKQLPQSTCKCNQPILSKTIIKRYIVLVIDISSIELICFYEGSQASSTYFCV